MRDLRGSVALIAESQQPDGLGSAAGASLWATARAGQAERITGITCGFAIPSAELAQGRRGRRLRQVQPGSTGSNGSTVSTRLPMGVGPENVARSRLKNTPSFVIWGWSKTRRTTR